MSGGYRAGAPPGDDAGVGANRPRNVERPPSGSDVARVPACPYCSIVYVRVNRHRLWERDAEYKVFAVVEEDRAFLERLYPRQDEPKLLPAPGST